MPDFISRFAINKEGGARPAKIKRAFDFVACLAFLAMLGGAAAAQEAAEPAGGNVPEEVDLALVLAVDVSSSVSTERWELQKRGYAGAFRSPEILNAIESGPMGTIAVTFVQWSGVSEQRQVVGWTTVSDADSAHSFAHAIEELPRVFAGSTSVSGAIDYSVKILQELPFQPLRSVIDVSGDGSSNDGRAASLARDEAAAQRITVNGLPIMGGEANLDAYYREQVVGGPGSFVVVAQDFDSFASAVLKKLILEIASLPLYGNRPGV